MGGVAAEAASGSALGLRSRANGTLPGSLGLRSSSPGTPPSTPSSLATRPNVIHPHPFTPEYPSTGGVRTKEGARIKFLPRGALNIHPIPSL